MKKILLIPSQSFPIPAVKGGAVETLLTQLIEENEKNKRVQLFVVSKDDEEAKKFKFDYSKIFYFNKKSSSFGFFVICFFRKLIFNRLTRRIFKKAKYGFRELNYFGYRCAKIAKKIKPDIVVSESYDHVHRLWPLVKLVGKDNFYYHLHYTKQEVLDVRKMMPNTIAISEFVLDNWVKDKTIGGRNVVLYNGIDLASFDCKLSSDDISLLRKSFTINDSDFVVLFTGRLRPHKGVLELLRAFNNIESNDIKLLLAGDFLSESKEHNIDESEFENKCLEIISQNKNIIRTGNVDYKEINKLYFLSDIQIIPSMWEEGAGLVAIEGMASGLPLIITNSGGMPEYTGKECAIILERDKDLEKSIMSSILLLKNKPELCKKMSDIGKLRAKQFSKDVYYQKYIDFLLESEEKQSE